MKTFVQAFVMLLVDYCNSLLAGSPNYTIDRLRQILNAAVQLVSGTVLASSTRVYHLCCSMICASRAYQQQAEHYCTSLLAGESSKVPYLVDCCTPVSEVASHRQLHSVTVDKTLLFCITAEHVRARGNMFFFSVASLLCGTLLDHLRDPALSSDSFRKLLKTELLNTLLAVEMLQDSALIKFTIDIDILPTQ